MFFWRAFSFPDVIVQHQYTQILLQSFFPAAQPLMYPYVPIRS